MPTRLRVPVTTNWHKEDEFRAPYLHPHLAWVATGFIADAQPLLAQRRERCPLRFGGGFLRCRGRQCAAERVRRRRNHDASPCRKLIGVRRLSANNVPRRL